MAQSALQSCGASGVGIPMAARELEDPIGGFVFALEAQGVEWHIFMNVLV